MADKKHIDEISGVETTGHEWDGIRELNNPMPRWWVYTFYATIVWAIGYTIMYPAWPLLTDNTKGLLGYSSRAEVAQELAAAKSSQAVYLDKIATLPLEEIIADKELTQFAVAGGAAAFKVNCSPCHGSGAAGGAGYPNLNDDDWLWGGDLEAIHTSIAHGIRYDQDPDTRFSEMPAYGDILDADQIKQVAAYVVSLTGTPLEASMVEPGQQIYAENCAACHGEDAKGGRDFGAPNLADAIWLKVDGEAQIAAQIRQPRHGAMPGWGQRLGDTTVKQLTVYVHQLGGGE
ncbi:MAG: cytochrome-c oxidase, cbb3-type subunit III [Alphaproteobacteria bacterium]|uniref:cytochrome-c oxidase, cbb3-type subunit III n=1 Tax=Rhizobium/Agrobacterium group TaxID=227290 RepID=UPI00129A3752|nr:cytochrome-c oxidase, cbb3-type subunit III [Agrobacterium sp. MA01]MBU0739851.1 cytochrome-c oxidase, cbb3-type subunit III [Alphaproteobacteria bacterium]MDM7981640.1 cytochrome-c oxidase, cbb3-type subunit III [Rhizobium sp.]MBU0834779.1 cytochrome-c oxidase, cbb3-type subunit III [Alphaproteobacteria bacterium]MBU1763610.1 cytochrome-c oxidase, cbb3-type subunit III [Alphaproteobacteria bacterium]MDM8014542.1 cytochrome-c oxidase, cbb3-type subunit III [Rhizobium sp.]